jgi:uncharacterized protein YdhG (YjbR/CyaY superfamily)
MQYQSDTPQQYLADLEDDWRKQKLLEIRDLIVKSDPTIEEGIEYKMLRYGRGDQSVFHLNAQKHYISLYVGNIEKVEKGKALLTGLDLGKGCIRIKKSVEISDTGLPEFVIQAIKLWQNGRDISC